MGKQEVTYPGEMGLEYLLNDFPKFNNKTVERILSVDKPMVTVVMLNWLRWNVFMNTLDHIIERQTIPMNISMIVQECTGIKKQNMVKEKLKKFSDYTVQFTKENRGTGPPRHKALHRALDKFDAPYIHFTDDDMRLPRFAVELMVSILEDNPKLGAVNMKTHPNSNIWIMNKMNKLQCIKPNLKRMFHKSLALGSATMVVRREVFETCDIDKKYIIGCADIDLGMQMTKAGWECAMITIPNWYAINVKGGANIYNSTRYDRTIIKESAARFQRKWGHKL